ncbi:MAG: hypothetical protein WAO02_09565 [Verrucomicrobiia bacterium]
MAKNKRTVETKDNFETFMVFPSDYPHFTAQTLVGNRISQPGGRMGGLGAIQTLRPVDLSSPAANSHSPALGVFGWLFKLTHCSETAKPLVI